jgi:hypothetical protein
VVASTTPTDIQNAKKGGETMTEIAELSFDELIGQDAALLPEREALAFINVAPVIGVNLSLAINAGSIGGYANAVANQYLGVGQF